jgi:hypothetical protein
MYFSFIWLIGGAAARGSYPFSIYVKYIETKDITNWSLLHLG